ncbi:restriction endonuclease subunit S [Pelosinus sp. sgz500959]|uniref:restriction endonuclease subunit S n=1 Tax=Pelosinus sp. sgz500959 TaxID=3242472 RepID=UPI00366C7063
MSFSEWKEVKLWEVCSKIGSGATPTGGANAYCDNGISLIRSQNVLDLNFSNNGLVYINEIQAKKLNNVTLEEGDVLLNITGDSVARSCIVPKEMLPARVNQHVAIIRGSQNQVYNKYILYYLQNNKTYLLSIAGIGGTRNALTKKMIENLNITLPFLCEQKAIADTLSCLDEKIELNNRINKTLEEMAQAIFKSWFVDFEPFQDGEFEDSELGKIPKGWSVRTIDKFTLDMKSGGTPSRKTKEYWNSNDVPWIKTGEISNAPIISNKEFISFEGLKNSSARLLPYNAVLVAMYGATAGKVGLLRFEASTNQACCAMICDGANKSIYLYLWLLYNQIYIEGLAVGAAQQNLSKDTISKINIVIPPDDILNSMLFDELFMKIENNLIQNQTLTTMRDSLLPKLMSGEIRVPIQEVQ